LQLLPGPRRTAGIVPSGLPFCSIEGTLGRT